MQKQTVSRDEEIYLTSFEAFGRMNKKKASVTCKQKRSEFRFIEISFPSSNSPSLWTPTGFASARLTLLTLDTRKGRHFLLYHFMFHFQFHYSFYKLLNVFLKLFFLFGTTLPLLLVVRFALHSTCDSISINAKRVGAKVHFNLWRSFVFIARFWQEPIKGFFHVKNWAWR